MHRLLSFLMVLTWVIQGTSYGRDWGSPFDVEPARWPGGFHDFVLRGQDSGGASDGGAEAGAAAATDPSAILTQLQIQNVFTPETYDASGYSNTLVLQPVLPFPIAMSGLKEFFPNHIMRPTLPISAPSADPDGPTGAWALAYYFDQVFWADRCNADRNLRVFTGWSLSDGNPSFARWNGMVSVEGYGLVAGREQDRMGVSYFYVGLSDDFKQLVSPVVDLEDVQGVELYYNAAITPWFHLTADLQIVDNENVADDTAIIVGMRGQVDF